MLPELSQLLNYRHDKVINSYMRAYPEDHGKASELFGEMLKYLWISNKHIIEKKQFPKNEKLLFRFVMHEEMRDIDNMWHNFILYTQDYTDFCQKYFGQYVHHVPDVAESILQTEMEFSTEFEKYLSYVYDNLGEETVRKWFYIHLN